MQLVAELVAQLFGLGQVHHRFVAVPHALMRDADAGQHRGDAVVLTDVFGEGVGFGEQAQGLVVFALIER